MKTILLLIIAALILVIIFMFTSYENDKLIAQTNFLETDREARLYMEYTKGCEARMMYLEHVLDKNGITYAP
jgi:uncharacterized protein YxeA